MAQPSSHADTLAAATAGVTKRSPFFRRLLSECALILRAPVGILAANAGNDDHVLYQGPT